MLQSLIFSVLILSIFFIVMNWLYILISSKPILICIPLGYILICVTPLGDVIAEYSGFGVITDNVSSDLKDLIDKNNNEPILKYRMKENAVSATRTIFCRSIIYNLNPTYNNFFEKNVNIIQKVNHFGSISYMGSCIEQLDSRFHKPKFLAPFLNRISVGRGSYLVYGTTKNIEAAKKFHSVNSSFVEKYIVDEKVFDGNRHDQYFILIDKQERMVKIIHNYNYCGIVCN